MNRVELQQALESRFDVEELRHLCFVLDINHENFSAQISVFARQLIEYCERVHNTHELIEACKVARPHYEDWKYDKTESSLESFQDEAQHTGRGVKISELSFLGCSIKSLTIMFSLVVILAMSALSLLNVYINNLQATVTAEVIAAVTETKDVEANQTPKKPTPSQTPNIIGSSIAANFQTEAARSTNTFTPFPTPTSTIDTSATFLASCSIEVELIEAHPYRVNNFNTVPVGVQFPMYWTLKNSGTCPWPQELYWVYIEGEDLAVSEELTKLELEIGVLPDEEVVITTDFVAPSQVGTFESTWQLFDANEEPFGSPIIFEIRTFAPSTSTPLPSPTTFK